MGEQQRSQEATPYSPSATERGEEEQWVSERVSEMADDARIATVRKAGEAREHLRSAISEQQARVAQRALRASAALELAERELRPEEALIADYVEMGRHRLERAASYLSETEPSAILEDVRDLARARPAWFAGGAFVAGLLVARFIRGAEPVEHGGRWLEAEGRRGDPYPIGEETTGVRARPLGETLASEMPEEDRHD